MTREEKQLLLKDLCGRLPYGVKCVFHSKDGCIPSTILRVDVENEVVMFADRPDMQKDKSFSYLHCIEDMKPYLRPMSSMTPDERFEYDELNHFYTKGLTFNVDEIDWLLAHHFDYQGLIPMGLALEAPQDMYKID